MNCQWNVKFAVSSILHNALHSILSSDTQNRQNWSMHTRALLLNGSVLISDLFCECNWIFTTFCGHLQTVVWTRCCQAGAGKGASQFVPPSGGSGLDVAVSCPSHTTAIETMAT